MKMKMARTMKMMRMLWCVMVAVMAGRSADAGFVASFTANGNAPLPTVLNVGETLDVSLYLRYDGNGPNLLADYGLLGAGLGITMSQPGIAEASFLSLGAGWDPDPFLSGPTIDNGAGTAILQTTVGFFDPAVTDPGTGSILLGTFRFTGVSAGTTLLTLGDALLGYDDTLVNDGAFTILDDDIIYGETLSFTVNGAQPVPEPSSSLALIIGMTWFACRKRIRVSCGV